MIEEIVIRFSRILSLVRTNGFVGLSVLLGPSCLGLYYYLRSKDTFLAIKPSLPQQPTSLLNLGYRFDLDGKLVDKNGEPYKFVDNNHYELLCSLLIDHIQTSMRNDLLERKLPGETKINIFHSINVAKYFKIIIIIQNTGRERAGVWSCKNTITEGLKTGTMNNFIQKAQSLNFGVIISNPNSFQEEQFHSKRSMNINNHIQNVLEFASSQPRCTSIHILGYGSGGSLALHLMKDKVNKKMKSIAFVDSHHTITDVELTPPKINWLKQNSKHWIASNEPLGDPLDDHINSGFNSISGGSEAIGGSLFSAMDSILAYFEEKSDSV